MSQFPGKLGRLSRCEHTISVIVCAVADVIVCFTNTNAVSAIASFKLKIKAMKQKMLTTHNK